MVPGDCHLATIAVACGSKLEATIIPAMSLPLDQVIAALEMRPPWLAPYQALALNIAQQAARTSVAHALDRAAANRVDLPRFVEQAALPASEPYEAFIARTRTVPTRHNAHDLFNGLLWLCYPQTKWRLNRLQAQQLALHGVGMRRGPARDALTLFDENAALLQAPATLIEALRRREWRALFVEHRALWSMANVRLFGHALIEKLLQPRKPITAHVWVVASLDDACVAASLQIESLAAKPFLPLPVLGVPGWWAENATPAFYDDADVFRPQRSRGA